MGTMKSGRSSNCSRLFLLQLCLFAALGSGCAAPSSVSSNDETVGTTSSEVSAVTLKSIGVTPTPTTLYAGMAEALTATGTYSNGTTQNLTSTATWTSSNTNVATVSAAGIVTTITNGTATITAQSGTVKGKATVKVSVTLTSMAVTPSSTTLPANATQALKATGSYSNGTTKTLTGAATWASNNPAVATVSSTGLVVTVAPGTTTIMATLGGSSNAPVVGMATITVDRATITSVAVTPATKKLPDGHSLQFKATATFGDGTTQVLVPPVVSWTSSVPAIATISATGLASSVAVGGPTTITATPLGSSVTGKATLTVTNATLVSVAVAPFAASASAGLTQQFSATGTYTDGSTMDISTQVTWTSSATTVATVSTAGLATSLVAGSAGITATDPKTKKASTGTLTVTPAVLQSIALSPAYPTVPAGLTTQLDAVGTWTDGTTQDVTSAARWTSSTVGVATVSQGLVTALTTGTTTITATDPTTQVTQSVTLTATPGLLVSIAVTPANPSVPLGTTGQLVATATYTDGSTGIVTQSVTWLSSSTAVAVANAPGPAGEVTALTAPGSSVVSATDPASGISGQTTVTAAAPACAGLTACGSTCVDTTSDSNNCGGCGTTCTSGQTCSASSCVAGATLRVHYPAAGHAITIRGGVPGLSWTAPGQPTVATGDTFTYSIPALAATAEWKPVLDDTTFALGPNYHVSPGQTVDVWPHFTSTNGQVVTLMASFHSTALDDDRPVYAYLPASYGENTDATYPVVYMQDGQNLWAALPQLAFATPWDVDTAFDAAAATGACSDSGVVGWGAQPLGGTPVTCNGDSDCASGECRTFPEAIVIGVSSDANRIFEYTPTTDPSVSGGGGADLYVQRLVQELKPTIDGMLRTRPDVASTAMAGSSLGGLVTAYAGFTRPDVFGLVAELSPSAFWNNDVIVADVSTTPAAPRPLVVYVDSGQGTVDDESDIDQLAAAYLALGYVDGTNFRHVIQPGAQHSEVYWAERFPGAMQLLLGVR